MQVNAMPPPLPTAQAPQPSGAAVVANAAAQGVARAVRTETAQAASATGRTDAQRGTRDSKNTRRGVSSEAATIDARTDGAGRTPGGQGATGRRMDLTV